MAGSTPLNHIDVFHDREERVAQAAEQDAALLQKRGYSLQWLRRDPGIDAVSAERSGDLATNHAT